MLRLNVWPAGPITACLSNTYLLSCLPLFPSSHFPIFPSSIFQSSNIPIFLSSFSSPIHPLIHLHIFLVFLFTILLIFLQNYIARSPSQPLTYHAYDEQAIYMGWLCERKENVHAAV